jgi:hypothetical protein
VIGTGLDVWELVELYEGKGKKRLLSEHNLLGVSGTSPTPTTRCIHAR